MNIVEQATGLLEEKFQSPEFHDCFIVDITYDPIKSKLAVFLDSDSGIKLEQCHRLSRYLEGHFDENLSMGPKYTLEVSSAGLDRPLKFHRQYVKNIGRKIRVWKQDDSKMDGTLDAVHETLIVVSHEVKKKIEGKNKKMIEKQEILFEDILKSKVLVTF